MRQLSALAIAGVLSFGLIGASGCVADAGEELDLEFGTGSGENYLVFDEGSTCNVVYAAQGGYFIMVSLRSNVADQSLLSCGLEVDDELIAESLVRMRQGETSVIGGLALPIFPGYPERVGEVDGRSGLLYCDVEGERADVLVSLEVIYAEPEPETQPIGEVEEYSSASIVD